MSKHSKNNNARGYFTYEEKRKLKYGTITQRIGRDSFRNFDSCYLCLQTARTPLSCLKGHIACKECLYDNVIAQKEEWTRQEQLFEAQEKAHRAQEALVKIQQKEREMEQFESTQLRVGLKESKVMIPSQANQDDPVSMLKTDPTKIASFWIPENAPSAEATRIERAKFELQCFATSQPHHISLKKLIEVQFDHTKAEKLNGQKIDEKICPSCKKTLTNGTKIVILRHCGHVLCKVCADDFVKPSKKCVICDEKCKERDIIDVSTEGTGFAGGGGNVEVKKAGEAFQ